MAKFRSAGLKLFLRMPVKYKAPAVVSIAQEEIYIFDNVTAEWKELREQFRIFLDSLDPVTAKKLIYRHPFGGRLNIYQALSFFFEHMEHHRKQIERIKQYPGFPAT